ncbi:large-conductance mechanosensitive channel [bacterium BMS3Bbin02]|nr:large-conductance mechanosensitive channel [bacterium BMS3Bbin02]HDH26380.1 large conductance mechanosensitive channel protein MscL [Actinomycetota bacterium]
MKDFIDGFKKFAMQGNVIEIAIGLVMALAFKPIIDSLIDGILMPIVGAVFGEPNFNRMTIELGDNGAEIFYGSVITELVIFAATAFALYLFVVKPYDAYKARQASGEEEAPTPDVQTVLLTEIRDALQR